MMQSALKANDSKMPKEQKAETEKMIKELQELLAKEDYKTLEKKMSEIDAAMAQATEYMKQQAAKKETDTKSTAEATATSASADDPKDKSKKSTDKSSKNKPKK